MTKSVLAFTSIGILILVATFLITPAKNSSTQISSSEFARPSIYDGVIPPPDGSVAPSLDIAVTLGLIPEDWPEARACTVSGVPCTELMDVPPRLCPAGGACDGQGRFIDLANASWD